MRIVDTHHHLWDLCSHYYPWLTDKILPKLYGDYAPIRRDYLIGDFLADIGSLPVVKSVHVNAGFDPRQPVRETEWLQAIADDAATSRGFPHGIVGDVDLTGSDAKIRDFDVPLGTGRFSFDEGRNAQYFALVLTIKGGKITEAP
jgi:predicted TIM-barrel fold metal-dependent hydrolase